MLRPMLTILLATSTLLTLGACGIERRQERREDRREERREERKDPAPSSQAPVAERVLRA